MIRRVTIIKTRHQVHRNINDDLKWIGTSLGLFSLRDKNSSCFRIFINLLRRARERRLTSSDELAELTGLTRGTVVHHLNILMDAGIVVREQKGYILRTDRMEVLVQVIRHDVNTAFDEIEAIAADIDKHLG